VFSGYPTKPDPKPRRKRTCAKCSSSPDGVERPWAAQQEPNAAPNKGSKDCVRQDGNGADAKQQCSPTSAISGTTKKEMQNASKYKDSRSRSEQPRALRNGLEKWLKHSRVR
jgi:hypothetical protein